MTHSMCDMYVTREPCTSKAVTDAFVQRSLDFLFLSFFESGEKIFFVFLGSLPQPPTSLWMSHVTHGMSHVSHEMSHVSHEMSQWAISHTHPTCRTWLSHASILGTHIHIMPCVAVCCSVLQCVAVCCSVLQCDTWYTYTHHAFIRYTHIHISHIHIYTYHIHTYTHITYTHITYTHIHISHTHIYTYHIHTYTHITYTHIHISCLYASIQMTTGPEVFFYTQMHISHIHIYTYHSSMPAYKWQQGQRSFSWRNRPIGGRAGSSEYASLWFQQGLSRCWCVCVWCEFMSVCVCLPNTHRCDFGRGSRGVGVCALAHTYVFRIRFSVVSFVCVWVRVGGCVRGFVWMCVFRIRFCSYMYEPMQYEYAMRIRGSLYIYM